MSDFFGQSIFMIDTSPSVLECVATQVDYVSC